MKQISIDNIQVSYSESKLIINDLSIELPAGKVTIIIGPNGCGKSTLLKAVGRILNLKKGVISLEGNNIHKMPTKELAKELAILPQSPSAPEGITVKELISYGRYPYQRGIGKLSKEDNEVIDWAIKATNLEGLEDRTVDNLSGGQRQRIWIAMALAQKTGVILLDEPTTYLDMAYQLEVLELLSQLNKEHGSTIVMVLHDINLAARFADYMIAMKSGKIIKAAKTNEVMTKEVLRSVFNIEANLVKDKVSGKPICLSYELINSRRENNIEIRREA